MKSEDLAMTLGRSTEIVENSKSRIVNVRLPSYDSSAMLNVH